MPAPRHALALLVVLAATAALAAGCGTDSITEKVVEEAAEQAAGEDVDIDVDDDKVSIKGKDGEIEIGGDELPADWPAEIELPDGATIASATSIKDGDEPQLAVSGTVDDMTTTEVYDHFAGQVDDWKQQTESTSDSGAGTFLVGAWTDGDHAFTISVTGGGPNGEVAFVASYSSDPAS